MKNRRRNEDDVSTLQIDRLVEKAEKLVAAIDRQREAGHGVSPAVSIQCNAVREELAVIRDAADAQV